MGGLTSGGAEHQMVVLACLLKKRGYDVTYLTSGNDNFFQKKLEEASVPLIRIKENRIINVLKLSTPYLTKQIGAILRQGQYDTVISFLGFWNYENCLFANRKGTAHRAITGIRNNRDEIFLAWRDKYYTRYERYAYRKVSNSDAAKRKFGEYFPQFTEKLMTIYNIVDLPPINSSYTPRRNNRIHIIVPASYRAVKNPMGLLHALVLLKIEDRKKLHIDWYGNIKSGKQCYSEMTEFIYQNGLEEVITLHDATNDIANRINEADIVGLFSISEGLPNAICEGMMLGKPVIMTRVSDYEILANRGNGFLCDSDKPQTIANALSAISKMSDDEIKEMGTASQKKALSYFSIDAILKQWEEIL